MQLYEWAAWARGDAWWGGGGRSCRFNDRAHPHPYHPPPLTLSLSLPPIPFSEKSFSLDSSPRSIPFYARSHSLPPSPATRTRAIGTSVCRLRCRPFIDDGARVCAAHVCKSLRGRVVRARARMEEGYSRAATRAKRG